MPAAKPDKAKIIDAISQAELVSCLFNPSEFTVTRTNKWTAKQGGGDVFPKINFGGNEPATLQLQLLFDTYEAGTDVRQHTNRVMDLMKPSQGPRGGGKRPEPPYVMFCWGGYQSFVGVVTKVQQKFILFTPKGTPVRAVLDVTLQQVEPDRSQGGQAPSGGQNPSSQGETGHRVRVVQQGDTIDLIAAQEYGDPGRWRLLADANALDNPRLLKPGTALVVPAVP